MNPAARFFAFGDAEFRSRNQAPNFTVGAQACATATAWFAVTALMIRSQASASARCESLSLTPCFLACARIGSAPEPASFRSYAASLATPSSCKSSARMRPTSP